MNIELHWMWEEAVEALIQLLLHWSRRFKTIFYRAASWTLTLGCNGLAICYCDAWPARLCVCSDSQLIKFKVLSLHLLEQLSKTMAILSVDGLQTRTRPRTSQLQNMSCVCSPATFGFCFHVVGTPVCSFHQNYSILLNWLKNHLKNLNKGIRKC